MRVSVVTPTIRKEGLDVVQKALKNQTFKDFEWLISSPFDPGIPTAKWIPDKFTEGYWSLNRAYNSLFVAAQGDLIVSLQDWIWVPPTGIEQFIDAYESSQGIISGVGDQYERVGQYGKPEVKIWTDPRRNSNYGSFYECYPNDAEWNWCLIPKQALIDIGGMDEQLDFLGYGGDQLQAVERMDTLGYKFFLDQTNESYTVRHDRGDFGGQDAWDKDHVLFNGKYKERKKELINNGQWPVLDYL